MRYLVTILFVLIVLVGCSRRSDISQRDPERDILLHAQADALASKIVLTELREGRLTNALELLEMQIDTSVILIDHSLTNLSGSEREMALGTLRSLKAYREAHPRQQESVIPDAEKPDAETLKQANQKAFQILSDVK